MTTAPEPDDPGGWVDQDPHLADIAARGQLDFEMSLEGDVVQAKWRHDLCVFSQMCRIRAEQVAASNSDEPGALVYAQVLAHEAVRAVAIVREYMAEEGK